MELVFSGGNAEALRPLLADNFSFRGPLYRYDSAEEYITAMASDPLKSASYRIIRSFKSDDAACLIYQFTKPGVSTPMTQLFEVSDGRIFRVRLMFDSAAFA